MLQIALAVGGVTSDDTLALRRQAYVVQREGRRVGPVAEEPLDALLLLVLGGVGAAGQDVEDLGEEEEEGEEVGGRMCCWYEEQDVEFMESIVLQGFGINYTQAMNS